MAYGLCIQGLGKSILKTNLLPEEIVRTRLINAKKPWAVAGVAALLAGLTVNYFAHVSAWRATDVSAEWATPLRSADNVVSKASGFSNTRSEIHTSFEKFEEIGQSLVSNGENRLQWLETVQGHQRSRAQGRTAR